jgi:tetratricopeptide (TPR) repeat protein
MKKILCTILSISTLYASPVLVGGLAKAQAEETKKSVRVPAMRNRVYTQLARAQQIADNGDKAEGLAVLDAVKDRLESLNSYEKSMLWNFYGFMHYANEDLVQAKASFKNVVAQDAIPESLRLSTLYSLAQLSMQQQAHEETLNYLNLWKEVNTKALTASQHMLFAQVHYQDNNFTQSLISIGNAIEVANANNQKAKENWLILQRANYYELKQPEKVTEVMELMVKLYSKPEYWIQLASMYGEIGQEKKQMGAMETAWQAGYITKDQDIITLVQLYRFNGAPFKAAKLLDESIASGKVVATVKHLEMLAQSYVAAKNDEKAIPVLAKAAEIADTGKFDAQLAQAYLNLENWDKAIETAKKALDRGGISREGDMHLILGMSYFNVKLFSQSLTSFERAESIKASEKTAKQWIKYVSREKQQAELLAMLN